MIDQHLPHDARHQRQKVRTIRQLRLRTLKQLDERFIDECRRLQCVAGLLPAHERPRDSPQLVVDERHQFVERVLVSRADPLEQKRDLMSCNSRMAHVNRSFLQLGYQTQFDRGSLSL
jgi:hypothetical protein